MEKSRAKRERSRLDMARAICEKGEQQGIETREHTVRETEAEGRHSKKNRVLRRVNSCGEGCLLRCRRWGGGKKGYLQY